MKYRILKIDLIVQGHDELSMKLPEYKDIIISNILNVKKEIAAKYQVSINQILIDYKELPNEKN